MTNYEIYMEYIKALPNKNVVYVLCDPITQKIRYIGKAVNLYVRIRKHLNNSKLKDQTHKNNWIKSLLNNGYKPKVLIVEECIDEKSLNEAEIKWILYYKNNGCDLTNATDGGDGGRMSPEAISKIIKTKTGKKFSSEHKEKLSKTRVGLVLSQETKDKIGIKHKGKIVSKETKLKQSLAHQGQPAWNKGKTPSLETREKMRQSRLNYLKNQELIISQVVVSIIYGLFFKT